jgi:Tfp pilus assembly protein PilF
MNDVPPAAGQNAPPSLPPPVAAVAPPPAAPPQPPAETADNATARAFAAYTAKRRREALGICKDILVRTPDHAPALALSGAVLADSGEDAEAIRFLTRAIALHDNNASWHLMLGQVYRRTGKLAEAKAAIERGAAMEPVNTGARLALAQVLRDAAEFDKAKAHVMVLLGLDPDNAAGHSLLGDILLTLGETEPAWVEFDWRARRESPRAVMPQLNAPAWNGMRLTGRLLVMANQPVTDVIPLSRFLPQAAARCGGLVVGVDQILAGLIGRIPGVSIADHRWEALSPNAAHVSMLSLPALLQMRGADVPRAHPYLTARTDLIAAWAGRLPAGRQAGEGPRIGIAWNAADPQPDNAARSLRLTQLAPLAQIPGLRFVPLQRGLSAEDRAMLPLFPGAESPHLPEIEAALGDMEQLAALIASMDLVVSVDDAVAHLAGALRRDAYVLVSRSGSWVWGAQGETTPWYGTARVFRQQEPGQWEPVIEVLAAALRARAGR